MAKNLVIVESPAKSKTLMRFLGKDYTICSTIGHVVDLPKSKIGVDPDNNFEVEYEIIKGKEKIIAELKKAAKAATNVYLAPDPDREGEAIAWHVANVLKKTRGMTAKVQRVTFNEITKTAVLGAMKNPREIDLNLVNAQQARRVLDRLVGYIVSPILWKTIAYNLSAGRVQSVALRLICERQEIIDKFKPEEYWKITVLLAGTTGKEFSADLFKIDGKTVVAPGEKGSNKIVISSKKEVTKYLTALKKATFAVDTIKQTKRERKSPAPFITSTLQQDAAKVFGFSPKQTMAFAQKLYEGIEMGAEGTSGLITYMRTDSTRVADEAIKAVRQYIGKEYGSEYVPSKPLMYGKKKSTQDAHEAIRPTYMNLPPAKVKKHLQPRHFKLYTLIWNRFVASQMMSARYSIETVDITADKFLFRASAQKIVFDGFLRVYHEGKESDENGNGNSLGSIPALSDGEALKRKKLTESQSFTKPPARFSEAMLVKRLEADGIGRPSTYASIISTLKDRKYVELTDKRMLPTDLGNVVNKVLVTHFNEIFDVSFTANMEKELDLVEEGTDDWKQVLKDFYVPFMKTVAKIKGKEKAIKESLIEMTDHECPKCSSKMVIKMGRNGRFLACSAYPDCKSTRPLPEDEEKQKTDKKCEKCGSDMVIKTGRFGRFMACSAYPDCKNTMAITLGIACPKDGCKGELVEKQTRTRRLFFGCTKYPKCDFASWDRPVDQPCPICKHAFMVFKSTKGKGEFLKCPECKHEVAPEVSEKSPA